MIFMFFDYIKFCSNRSHFIFTQLLENEILVLLKKYGPISGIMMNLKIIYQNMIHFLNKKIKYQILHTL